MLLASSVAVTHRTLATIDLVIIGVYFAIVFGIGMYFAMKERSSEDYFLAGRDIGWFFIGASLFVSNISTDNANGLLCFSAHRPKSSNDAVVARSEMA